MFQLPLHSPLSSSAATSTSIEPPVLGFFLDARRKLDKATVSC
jgi:hypothetical protein